MFLFLVPLLCAASVESLINRGFRHDVTSPSAASTSQIQFAIENNYDDTGPASQRPVEAFNTYKSLEDALVGYFDDPDTQLPPSEKAKAVQKLLSKYQFPVTSIAPAYKQSIRERPPFQHPKVNPLLSEHLALGVAPLYEFPKAPSKIHGALSIAHYARDGEPYATYSSSQKKYSELPTYYYAYGVNDPHTGDIKRAEEKKIRDTVHGFYRFYGPDGKERLVQYKANDRDGFKAQIFKLTTNNYK